MITVSWTLADGTTGETTLEADDKWTLGRAGEDVTVTIDDPAVSRSALTIRDSGPGPVVFRGQRDNGARVSVTGGDETRWLDEGMAAHLADGDEVRFHLTDMPAVTVSVGYEDRGSVAERRPAE